MTENCQTDSSDKYKKQMIEKDQFVSAHNKHRFICSWNQIQTYYQSPSPSSSGPFRILLNIFLRISLQVCLPTLHNSILLTLFFRPKPAHKVDLGDFLRRFDELELSHTLASATGEEKTKREAGNKVALG